MTDSQAVEAVLRDLAEAWNAGDATAFADVLVRDRDTWRITSFRNTRRTSVPS